MRLHVTTFHDGRPHYVVDDAGCWLWQGAISRGGYGFVTRKTTQRLAHRWYYELHYGALAPGLHVHHICGVRHCVNPGHLKAMRPQENLARRYFPRRPPPSVVRPQCPPPNEPEEWRAVPGYEGYYSVSDLGRVRRDRAGRGTRAGRMCSPHRYSKGYLRVTLTKDAQPQNCGIHRLVAAAFLRAPLPGEQVNHKNGVKSDNRPCNLEWCSGQQNMDHARANGLRPQLTGARNGRAKLDGSQVEEIRWLRTRMRQVDIAALYRIAQSQVSAIQRRVSWAEER